MCACVFRPHHNYYNKEDYNSNELEGLRRKQTNYRKQLEELLEEHHRDLFVAVLVALSVFLSRPQAQAMGLVSVTPSAEYGQSAY